MATTSIWRVKGWLGKVVIYVENPDKTENPAFYEKQDMTDRQAQGLSDVIDYAVNSDKTQASEESTEAMQQFVSGVNCHPATARDEMIAVKKRFGKEDGTVAYHGYQSFAPGEATPEIAHEIGIKLAQRLWGEKYQVIVATHLDKENHLHNHFVVNTVSFVDGLKYHRTEKDYYEMQKSSDTLCREYGLSVIENPQRGKSKQYGEWRAEQEGRPTWRGIIRTEIDEVIRQSMTERQFFDNLKKRGYEVKVGKDISVRPSGKPRFVRLERNFGEDYSLTGIRRRILAQQRAERPLPEPKPKVRRAVLRGNLKSARKITGFRALYFHYCYLLGIFPKNRPVNNKRLHFLLREDLAKLDAILEETKLLVGHRIDTDEQLFSYQEGLEQEIEALTTQRKTLYRKQRTVAVKSNPVRLSEVKVQISSISKELAGLRREVKLCDDIAVHSGVMREKIKAVREDEQSRGKENNRNEQFRRRGGTDREAKS
uniref:relaxase/mobilization nuclease domain-containing protein n=1 Tax=Enterocloster clostridioformis TaxID=1531 RepID=UPI001C3D2E6E|nr:relaxase/mobilization nuclease domain-containing protein [Enterocloster clostridioformis]